MIDPNGYGTILPSKGLRDYYCSVIDPNSGYPLSRSIVIYQTTPKTRYVLVSLVKKTEYIESDRISSKYFHLGDYNCFIRSTGQYPRIRIELEISSNKSLLMKFTHIQTDESVSFENLDQLKGEEIFLQEEIPSEQFDKGDDSTIPFGEFESQNVWTNDHLEKTCTFAHLLFTRLGSPQSIRLNKKIEEIQTLLATHESEDTRLILNRTQELLDILKNEKVITQDEFSYYLLELRKIAYE
jgi:hypothetical protein